MRKIWLSLDAAIDKMAARYKVPAAGPFPHILLPYNFEPYVSDEKAFKRSIYMYQQKVGSINYIAVNTRPDIARAASKLSQFLQNLSLNQSKAVNYLLRYLLGIKTRALQYNRFNLSARIFYISSDAFYGDNPDWKSSFGFCFQLYGGPIQYKASK